MAPSFVHEIAVGLPLALSLPVTLGTIVIHALALVGSSISFATNIDSGAPESDFWADVLSYRPQRSCRVGPLVEIIPVGDGVRVVR